MKFLILGLLLGLNISYASSDNTDSLLPVGALREIHQDQCSELSMKYDRLMTSWNKDSTDVANKVFNYTNCVTTMNSSLDELSSQCLVTEDNGVDIKTIREKVTARCSRSFPKVTSDIVSFYAHAYCKEAVENSIIFLLDLVHQDMLQKYQDSLRLQERIQEMPNGPKRL